MAKLTGQHICHLSETFGENWYIWVDDDGDFRIQLEADTTLEEDDWLESIGWERLDPDDYYYNKD